MVACETLKLWCEDNTGLAQITWQRDITDEPKIVGYICWCPEAQDYVMVPVVEAGIVLTSAELQQLQQWLYTWECGIVL